MPDGLVSDAILLRESALGWQFVTDFADLDACGDVIGDLDVREIRAEWIYDRHTINVGSLLAA